MAVPGADRTKDQYDRRPGSGALGWFSSVFAKSEENGVLVHQEGVLETTCSGIQDMAICKNFMLLNFFTTSSVSRDSRSLSL